MNVQVEYTGQLRTAIGRSQDRVEVPIRSTVADLLKRLSESCHESSRPHLLTSEGAVQPSLMVAINGTVHVWHQLDSAVLRDGDIVVLLPPIGGG